MKILLLAFAAVIFMGLFFNIIFFEKLTRNNDLNNICKVYYKHGTPRFVEVNGHEYDLQNIKQEDLVFMNPWTREIVENTKIFDCLQIKE